MIKFLMVKSLFVFFSESYIKRCKAFLLICLHYFHQQELCTLKFPKTYPKTIILPKDFNANIFPSHPLRELHETIESNTLKYPLETLKQ